MINTLQRNYFLVTPVKNEEKYLPGLIKSIENQTIKPILWVIVDDNSSDRTPYIIKNAKEKNTFIQSILLEESFRDRGTHLAKIIRIGFDFAYDYCNGLCFDYLGNIDADVVLEKTYFEKLIEKFEKFKDLGVASGAEWIMNGGKISYFNGLNPAGGDVLYRKKCYEDCGGIPISELWDSVMNTKAILRGWNIKRFDDSKAYIMRGYCDVDGMWIGYKKFGESDYIVNYNSLYALAKGVKLLFKKPFYIGFAFLYGYFGGMIYQKKQINDDEIKNYYNNERPKELKRYYINKLRKMLHF